nr:hypothetical protein GCM10020063_020450 [Dactylosporangium thailandense]
MTTTAVSTPIGIGGGFAGSSQAISRWAMAALSPRRSGDREVPPAGTLDRHRSHSPTSRRFVLRGEETITRDG